VAKTAGVVAEPEISDTMLTNGDAVLIIASDGVWDVLSVRTCMCVGVYIRVYVYTYVAGRDLK
jgi:hypothetical protein